MINVGELIHDPDFCTELKIHRKVSGEWIGGRQKQKDKVIEVEGIVAATTSEDMELLSEGDRIHGLKTFYTDTEFRLTDNETTSDICEYKGLRYRLLQVFNCEDFGYYKAIGTRIGGV